MKTYIKPTCNVIEIKTTGILCISTELGGSGTEPGLSRDPFDDFEEEEEEF
ncbi:MAG: hypothetical protein J5770_05640 [Bacteroidaceae bacterium]|nr:hypothetical protein [Bacteroidaceae bacterium]